MVGSVAQLVGVVLVSVGGWLVWSPWALVAGGALLVIGPEVPGVVKRK